MDELIKLIVAENWRYAMPVLTFLYLATKSPYSKIWQNETDRKRLIGTLIQNRAKTRYRHVLASWLRHIDSVLSPDEIARDSTSSLVGKAWSFTLINYLMMFAVALPVWIFLASWISGNTLSLGKEELLPTGSALTRVNTGIWSLGSLSFFLIFAITNTRWRVAAFILATLLLFGGILFFAQLGIPRPFAVAGMFAFAYFLGEENKLASAGAYAFAFVLAFVGAFNGMDVLTGAFAVAGAATGFLINIERRQVYHTGYRIILLIFILMVFTASLSFAPEIQEENASSIRFVIVFFCILPPLNALSDFAAIGLTRYQTRKGLARLTWWHALIDVMGGLLVILALGITLISYFHWLRPVGGLPLLDMQVLFDGLARNKSDYWWLGLLLAYSLIPTLLHFILGTLTVLLQYPFFLRAWVVTKLESGGAGHETDGWWGMLVVCAMITASIWVPIIGFYYIITLNHGAVLNGVIDLFRAYASLIGAIAAL